MKFLGGRLLSAIVAFVLASPLQAMTDAQIEERFRQLEAENSALRQKLQQVEQVLKQRGIDADSVLVEQPVVSSAPAKSEGQHDRRLSQLEYRLDEAQDRLSFDGFLSAGFSYNSEPGGLKQIPYGFDENLDFSSDAVAGLQTTYRINEELKAVLQLVANGWDDWAADIDWAYLAYQFNDDWTMRAGRLRLPFYLYSESLDVGYSYPFVRPPLTIYTTEISNYDGFDLAYGFSTGEVNHRLSSYVGSFRFNVNEHDQDVVVSGDEVYGVNWTSYWSDWTWRAAYNHLKNTASFERELGWVVPVDSPLGSYPGFQLPDVPQPLLDAGLLTGLQAIYAGSLEEEIDFLGLGTLFDNGRWLFNAEAIWIESDEVLTGNERGYYFTLGRHWGDLMPYGGYGREYYTEPLDATNLLARTPDKDFKLLFAGLRYDIRPGVAAKLEWNGYYDFKGTGGPFWEADAYLNGQAFDRVDMYTFLIDAVF